VYLKKIGWDRPGIEIVKYLKENEEQIFESAKFINLSSSFIYRIYALHGELDAALESKKQYLNFSNNLLEQIKQKENFLSFFIGPNYSIDKFQNDFLQLHQGTELFLNENEISIELNYNEVENAALQKM
jgi:hypothetical protein